GEIELAGATVRVGELDQGRSYHLGGRISRSGRLEPRLQDCKVVTGRAADEGPLAGLVADFPVIDVAVEIHSLDEVVDVRRGGIELLSRRGRVRVTCLGAVAVTGVTQYLDEVGSERMRQVVVVEVVPGDPPPGRLHRLQLVLELGGGGEGARRCAG